MSDNGNGRMTKWEAAELAKVIRKRCKVAMRAAEARSAELRADFEAKLSAIFKPDDDPVWKQLRDDAARAVAEADARIAERCRELGIPEDFRPGFSASWYGRGVNALRQRRDELRKLAYSCIASLEKKAKAEIERRAVEAQERLVAGGLESSAAREFLESIPTPAALMPALEVREVEGLHLRQLGRPRAALPHVEDYCD
jgi:hypothetical protein